MCTVTFVPTPQGALFTSNRDENPLRSTIQPQLLLGKAGIYISPIDQTRQGTWIGLHAGGYVLILLNGGFVNHPRGAGYRYSRGLVVTDLLATNNPFDTWLSYKLEGIEPFTLILWQPGNLQQLVWDGQDRHVLILDAGTPAIWSSATLYSPEAKAQKEKLFRAFINNNPNITATQLLHFVSTPHNTFDGFVINRGTAMQTVSISLMEVTQHRASFQYNDLLKNQRYEQHICFSQNTQHETA